jgi:hypothetical protein
MKCRCGSMAINQHCHGREPGVDLDLCDVCYWRARCGALSKERAEMVQALRNRRYRDRTGHGMTLRDSAAVFGVSASKLSKWTATDPTTEPDFVD